MKDIPFLKRITYEKTREKNKKFIVFYVRLTLVAGSLLDRYFGK